MFKKLLFFIVLFLLIISVSLNFYLYNNLHDVINVVHYDLNQNDVFDDIEEGIVEDIESGKLILNQEELEELGLIYKNKYHSIYEQCFGRIACITQSLNENK